MQKEPIPIPGCSARPIADTNIDHWKASINGPAGTPYEGGVFRLDIIFPRYYPYQPMQIKFETPIFHPNISRLGQICLDILRQMWSPNLTVSSGGRWICFFPNDFSPVRFSVMLAVFCLLCDPVPDLAAALNRDARRILQESREQFNNSAREYTLLHARR